MSPLETSQNIADLAQAADSFQQPLAERKQAMGAPEPGWYPYDSIGSFALLHDLLEEPYRDFRALAGGMPILDVGCADGTMAVFLAGQGYAMEVVDNPGTNYNEMRGVRKLNEAFQAGLAIWEANLDESFPVGWEKQYGLCLCMGLLYHLKNPFLLLERIAKQSRYLILTTRVARRAPGDSRDFSDLPLGYLVDADETNQDDTNFWVFTSSGMERLLKRSGWNILQWKTFGNTTDSDPATATGDERYFCLAESRSPFSGIQLRYGFHQPSADRTWRWTEQAFGLSFDRVPARVRLTLHYPQVCMERIGANRLTCQNQVFAIEQEGEFEIVLPGSAELRCRLDRAIAPGEIESRQLGLIVVSVKPEYA